MVHHSLLAFHVLPVSPNHLGIPRGQEVTGKLARSCQAKVRARSNISQPEHRTLNTIAKQEIIVPRTTGELLKASHYRYVTF